MREGKQKGKKRGGRDGGLDAGWIEYCIDATSRHRSFGSLGSRTVRASRRTSLGDSRGKMGAEVVGRRGDKPTAGSTKAGGKRCEDDRDSSAKEAVSVFQPRPGGEPMGAPARGPHLQVCGAGRPRAAQTRPGGAAERGGWRAWCCALWSVGRAWMAGDGEEYSPVTWRLGRIAWPAHEVQHGATPAPVAASRTVPHVVRQKAGGHLAANELAAASTKRAASTLSPLQCKRQAMTAAWMVAQVPQRYPYSGQSKPSPNQLPGLQLNAALRQKSAFRSQTLPTRHGLT